MEVWRLIVIGGVCACTSGAAAADGAAPAAPSKPARHHVKSPARKSTAGLDAPGDLRQAKAGDAFAPARSLPADPKGDLSFTYKWRASNAPNDPYEHVRELTPGGPGDAFMGGLKLGF